MKVLVTGGTGTIGSILVANLLHSNHEVTIITRNKSHVTNTWKEKVSIVEGDVTNEGDWQKSVDGLDGIINLAGENIFAKRWTANQKNKILESRQRTTQNLVDAIKNATKPPKIIVSVSGTDAYPASYSHVFTEEDETTDSFLGQVTDAWEKPLSDLDSTSTRYVIFRMGVAFSKSGHAAERMFVPHKFFVGGWIGSGNQIYSWIHEDDFVGLLQWGLETDSVQGIYNGVAPDYRTMKELATIGGDIMGRWTWTWAPGFMLKLVLGERADLLLGGRAVSSQKVIEAGYSFRFPNPETALEDILQDF